MDPNSCDIDSLNKQNEGNTCQYYTIQELLKAFSKQDNFDKSNSTSNGSINTNSVKDVNTNHNHINELRLLHINSRSISKNFDSVESLLQSLTNFSFSVIGISETWLHTNSPDMFSIPDYDMLHTDRKEGRGGGVALYVQKNIDYRLRKDIHVEGVEDIFIELKNDTGKKCISRNFV